MATRRAEAAAEKTARMRARRPQPGAPEVEQTPAADVPQDLAAPSPTPTPGETPAARPAERRVQRPEWVRTTVDLTPQMHADLEDWTRDTARSIGRPRVKRVEVIRELVRQLRTDEALAARVRDQLSRLDG